MNAMLGLLVPVLLSQQYGTSASSVWPAPTTANWPTGATNTSSSTPLSTSGFPMNPNAVPPPASGSSLFPGSSVGTINSGTSSGAWPTSTAPPSLSTGPRYTQPQPWQATPREVSISARLPADPVTAQPTSNGQANYPYPTQPTQPYQQPTYTQPTNAWGQPMQVAQAGYTPGTQPTTNSQFPQNGQYPTNTTTVNQQQQPGQQMQPGQQLQPGQQNGQPPINYVAGSSNLPKEPASPNDKAHTTAATTQQNDGQWLPLTLVLVGFLTSLACNLYFGWSTYQLRERYRLLLADRGAYST